MVTSGFKEREEVSVLQDRILGNVTIGRCAMDIGFIGLGTMGSHVCENLIKAGNQVRVWNRSTAAVNALVRLGAKPASTAREAFSGDAVFSMLADDAAVHAVIDPLLDDAPIGLVHVNMATISVSLARDLAGRHRSRGLEYVAAPVFGRPELAAAGKLTIVVAGEPGAVSRIEPLLAVIGQRTWPLGVQPERANVVKLAGNFMLGAAVEAMAEATAMAWRNGIEPNDLLDVLTNGVFTAPAYQMYGMAIAKQRYEPAGFKLSLTLKDLRLVLAAADEAGVPMPLADVVHGSLLEAVANGDGERDLAALAVVAMRRAGLEEASRVRERPSPSEAPSPGGELRA
jgi:3-hydroxyisobutyrate dehydrogenase-like beta-hydroxyacid dehydrogenase